MKFLDDNLIVNGWVHVDINGGTKTSDVVSLKNYNHVAIVLDFGNTAASADVDIAVYASDDVAMTHTVALNNYTFRKSPATTSSDSFAAEVVITDSKIDYVAAGDVVPNTDDNCIVVIEIDAVNLKTAGTSYDYDCIYLVFPNPSQACPVGCKFILSQPRHAADTLPSAIID